MSASELDLQPYRRTLNKASRTTINVYLCVYLFTYLPIQKCDMSMYGCASVCFYLHLSLYVCSIVYANLDFIDRLTPSAPASRGRGDLEDPQDRHYAGIGGTPAP